MDAQRPPHIIALIKFRRSPALLVPRDKLLDARDVTLSISKRELQYSQVDIAEVQNMFVFVRFVRFFTYDTVQSSCNCITSNCERDSVSSNRQTSTLSSSTQHPMPAPKIRW